MKISVRLPLVVTNTIFHAIKQLYFATVLQNVSAFVTGGASGLGLATSKMLLEHGCKVTICDIRRSKEIDELNGDFLFVETDVVLFSDVTVVSGYI